MERRMIGFASFSDSGRRTTRPAVRFKSAWRRIFGVSDPPPIEYGDSVKIGTHSRIDNESNLSADPSGSIWLGSHADLSRATVTVGQGAVLHIDESCVMQETNIAVGAGCSVTIGRDVRLCGVTLQINNGGTLELADGGIFACAPDQDRKSTR